MSEYMYKGILRSPDELIAMLHFRDRRIERLVTDVAFYKKVAQQEGIETDSLTKEIESLNQQLNRALSPKYDKALIQLQTRNEALEALTASLEEVRAKEYAFKQDRINEVEALLQAQYSVNHRLHFRIEALEAAINNFREGNYPNPRSYRPQDCPHGVHYWEECDSCNEEYWTETCDKLTALQQTKPKR